MDRRVLFFIIAAVVAIALTPVAPGEFRIVCYVVSGTYLLLAAAAALDNWSRNRTARRHHAAPPA